MADPHSTYWRGSRSEAIQAEYRALVSDTPAPDQAEGGAQDAQVPAGAVQLSYGDESFALANLSAIGDTSAE